MRNDAVADVAICFQYVQNFTRITGSSSACIHVIILWLRRQDTGPRVPHPNHTAVAPSCYVLITRTIETTIFQKCFFIDMSTDDGSCAVSVITSMG